MRIALLGPLQVETADGGVLDLRGHQARALTALLALRAGEVVTVDEITDALWPEGRAVTPNALHVQVSKLRRALTDGDDVLALHTADRGYRLDVAADDVDIGRFDRLARAGREQLAADRPDDAASTLDAALALWRGPALADITAEFAVIERRRLEEQRLLVRDHRIDALLACGQHEHVVAELEEAVTVDPLREGPWSQLMLALYRSGRQAEALRTFGRVRRTLIDEIGVEPGPALRRLEQAILRQDAALDDGGARRSHTGPGAGSAAAARRAGAVTNVRHEISSFVGRATDVEQLGALIADRRLVSIVGPGGVGKTRLASEVAARPSGSWPDGAWMLELQATSGSDGVARALLTCFGGQSGPADSSGDVMLAVDAVAAAVEDARVLLVLDNCEHVIADARSAVVGLLARCPNLRILTTSRVVLDVRGEGVRQLGPLPIEEAVTLFADRGLDAVHGFTVGHDNTGAIRSICEQVDRLPLGIELAAARLRAFTPTQLDAQLALRLSTTAGIGEGREPRHRTLPATVAWSYDLLFSPERALLRRLSVFRGSFALDAVEAVTIDDEMSPAEVGDALARLVDKSLVVAEHGDREPRFRLLRTVADFAAAALDPGETEALGRRHAEWIAQLAAEASPALRGPDQARWAARLHDEVPNIDAALAHARAGGDVATGVRTCVDLAWFALTTTALPTALDDVLALLAADAALPNALEARARAWVAVLGAGRPVAAVMGASAIDLARSLGDGHVLAEALIVTAMPLSRHVTTAGVAIASAQEGRALAGKTNDAWLVAAADAVEGGARGLTAEGLADAVARLERAGDGYSALGDRRSAEINAWYLSRALEDGGDLERAEAVLLPFVHGDGVPESAGAILATTQLSWLAQRHGDTAGAARHAGRLSGVAALQQRRLFWGTAQFAIGHAALVAGTLDASRAALTAALDMHLQIGMDGFVILEHALLGHVDALDGRDDESDAHHTESLRRAHAHALPLPLVLALELAAQSALVRRRAHDAGAWQARAAQLRGAHGLVATPHEQARGERALRAATAG